MKKILILCLLLAFASKIFSQVDTATHNTSVKTNYLKKSKNQKTTAWILLGTGTAMMVTGILVGRNSVENEPPFGDPNDTVSGGVLFASGVVVDLASVPFFIAGAKNKGRAMAVTMRNDFVPQLQVACLCVHQCQQYV
jgi:hypothetical protein